MSRRLRDAALGLDRLAGFFLFLFVLALPVSIAATHVAYAGAALAWLARLALVRRGILRGSPLDLPILAYWLLCALSASLSPQPLVSWGAMRKVGLIFVVLLVAHNVADLRRARQLVTALLVAGAASVAWTGWQYAAGIGLRVYDPDPSGAFYRAGLRHNDILLRVDGRLIRNPQEFLTHLRARPVGEPLRLRMVHGEGDAVEATVPAAELPRPTALAELDLRLARARPFRAQGFYSHYVTYAEVLQLLAALTFGLWLGTRRTGLGLLWLAFLLALGTTLTRAAWLGAAIACLAALWFHFRERLVGAWRAWLRVALPLALVAAGLTTDAGMRAWRGVGLIDPSDPSTDYRLLMWRDGVRLVGEHPWFGVGPNLVSLEWWKHNLAAYQKYHFQHHFHSTPIQLGVEWGLLVVAAWAALLAFYWRLLARLVARVRTHADPVTYGLALGILGGASGFLASALVHYNFGDSEAVLLFWFLAGLALALRRHLAAD